MPHDAPVTRRTFLATTSTFVATASLQGMESSPKPAGKIAMEGGERAIKESAPPLSRWGEPEREQLNAMLGQDTLFYWNGPRAKLLTERFQQICPLKYVMPCSSGSAAIHIAIAAAGIAPGDEVITAPITDIGTVIGIIYQQAVPVFADLGAHDYNLDPADVERRITPKTRAIVAVHLGGNPCDMSALRTLADKHKLVLIEDCAQAWGAQYQGKPIGALGHIACFSLQNSKQVTCGDGGIVASSDERFGPALQKYGDKGFDRLKPTDGFAAFAPNYRMSEPQAAVAAAQMARVENMAAKRSHLGSVLSQAIADIPGIIPHGVRLEDRCSYYFYMLRMDPKAFRCSRDELAKAIRAEGVPASAGYIRGPLYGEPVFQNHAFFAGRWPARDLGLTQMDYRQVKCPESEAILATCIRITITEAMSEDFIRRAGEGIRKVARHFAV